MTDRESPQPPQEAPEPEETTEAHLVPEDAPEGGLAPVVEVPKGDPHGRTPGDLSKGYARPLRDAAVHRQCGNIVVLRGDVARELAKSPGVLSELSCPHCRAVRPVGEFVWHGTGKVDAKGKMTGLAVGS